jgi:hypothetical protein
MLNNAVAKEQESRRGALEGWQSHTAGAQLGRVRMTHLSSTRLRQASRSPEHAALVDQIECPGSRNGCSQRLSGGSVWRAVFSGERMCRH